MRTELAFRYGKGCVRWHKIPVEWPFDQLPHINEKISGTLLQQLVSERSLSDKQIAVYHKGISYVSDIVYDYMPGGAVVSIYIKPSGTFKRLLSLVVFILVLVAIFAGYWVF